MPQTETQAKQILQDIDDVLVTTTEPKDRAMLLNDWGAQVLSDLDKKVADARARK